MNDPCFFGYGSLVNRATHVYADAFPARLDGWRRVWVHTELRGIAFLSAIPDSSAAIDGLVARVPGGDWAALDLREAAYDRSPVRPDTGGISASEVQVYAVPVERHGAAARPCPILLSYLDVVVQGYLQEFGEEGAQRFFDTTEGWDAPVLNDRAAPRYPRYQVLRNEETALVDAWLDRLGVAQTNL